MQTTALNIATTGLSAVQLKIIDVLAYFDIFNFPVTQDELCRLTGLSPVEILDETSVLIHKKKIYSLHNYYSCRICVSEQIYLRKQQEELAIPYFAKLKKYAGIISRFPFVRGIAVSGSLSKGVMQQEGDIDFFIITSANRLWLCRTLLVLYKKLVLFNSHKYFCLNYFVDENNLEIIDKNVFTATEIFYLLPVYSSGNTLQLFFETNQWSSAWLHTNTQRPVEYMVTNQSVLKSGVEKLFSNKLGDLFERMFHYLTQKKWMKKFGQFSKQKFELTMRSTAGVSKHHPRDFQSRVLKQHAEKVAAILSNT